MTRLWLILARALCAVGAWRSTGWRWRLYLAALERAGRVTRPVEEDEIPW